MAQLEDCQKRIDSVFLSEQDWEALTRSLRLSPREIELLQAILDDLKDNAIASKLGISVHTVRTHFERLFRKLDVRSRAGVVATAFEAYYRSSAKESRD